MALSMVQTDLMNLGTITAGLASFLILVAASFGRQISSKNYNSNAKLLLSFFVLTNIVSFLWFDWPLYYLKYAAQIIVCIVLACIYPINNKEYVFLEKVFNISTFVYAILVIYSCWTSTVTRSIHGDVILFGTAFDPNFIGLLFVAGSTLSFYNILTGYKKYMHIVALFAYLIAIFYTASRGSFLSLGISMTFALFFYSIEVKSSLIKKMLSILIVVGVIYFIYNSLSVSFEEQIERMVSLNEDNSDNGRLELWEKAWETWKSYPFFGVGLGGMYRLTDRATHNTYLELLSETGLVGLCIFGAFLIKLSKKIYSIEKKYLCMLICMLFQISFLDAFDNRCVWVILCWMVLISNIKNNYCTRCSN